MKLDSETLNRHNFHFNTGNFKKNTTRIELKERTTCYNPPASKASKGGSKFN